MNRLAIGLLAILPAMAAPRGWAQDAPKEGEKAQEKPAEKAARRLKGEFKGHPIAPPAGSESGEREEKKETRKPQPSQRSSGGGAPAKSSAPASQKQLLIDNTLVRGGAQKTKEKTAPPPSPVQSAPAPPAVVPVAPVDLNGNGEEYWRARAKATREHLTQAQLNLEAAQLEEKREENDFYAWDDGQYRDNVIKPAWDKSKEESIRAQEELTAAQKAVDDLDDEARKAGAYPGWIRE